MRLALICMMIALASPVAWADSIRCGNRVVRSEALAAEVIAACGAPDYRERWSPAYGVDEERWYYDFGPQSLVRVLRFHQGELVSVASDGYGFGPAPASVCAPNEFRRGVSAFRLLQRCGEPASRETFEVAPPPSYEDDSTDPPWPAYYERWVYDLGGDSRMRIVTLREGRVSEVEAGQYGSPHARR